MSKHNSNVKDDEIANNKKVQRVYVYKYRVHYEKRTYISSKK